MTQRYNLVDGSTLAYQQYHGRSPGVIFLGGFMSDMWGTKASYLDHFCRERNQAFLRFDYFGHGESSGSIQEGSIGRWKQDVLTIIDALTEGPQILVGSSLGGWLMILAALERLDRIQALVGVAPAPDFVRTLVYDQLSPAQQKALDEKGICLVHHPLKDEPFIVTKHFIEDGTRHEVLGRPIEIGCPVRLIHGVQDKDVPCSYSLRLMESLISLDVRVTLIKNGEHTLNTEENLKLLSNTLSEFLE